MRWCWSVFAAGFVVLGAAVILYVMTRAPAPSASASARVPERAPGAVVPQVAPPPPPPPPAPAPQRTTAPADSSAHAERDQLLARVVDGNGGHESWDDRGLAILDAIARAPITSTNVGCYMAGCTATFTFPSQASYQHSLDALASNDDYTAWTGGKQFTTPEVLGDGRVIVMLLLNRPD